MSKLQAWTTEAVVVASRQEVEAGGWLVVRQDQSPAIHARDRVGRHAANTLFGSSTGVDGRRNRDVYARTDRLLSNEQLWLVYQRTPDVRAAVDAIVRRVATWNWSVEPVLPPGDPGWEAASNEAEEIERRLQSPNSDSETWQELWTKVCTDLMVYDAGVIENVFDGERQEDGSIKRSENPSLEELVALRGSSVVPLQDTYGRIQGYEQNATGMLGVQAGEDSDNRTPDFEPDQIVYMRLFANTVSPLGVPLIDTLVNEIVTMMRSSEHSMLAFDADEIPPGILVLTGIAGKSAQAAKADLQNLRGKDHKVRVITNPDPKATGASWVELRHTAKDVDFVNVISQVRRTIWRVFGVMPVEMGASEDIPRNLGQVQLDVSTSHLITPILELIEAKVNASILPLLAEDPSIGQRLKFRFDRESKLSPGEQRDMAETLVALVREGVLTRNEARAIRGDAPVEGGDVMTLTTGQGVFPLAGVVVAGLGQEPPEEPEPDDDDDDDDPDGGGGMPEDQPDRPEEPPEPPENATRIEMQRSPSCRMPDESIRDCIARKIPEVMNENPGMGPDQVAEIAESMCSQQCESHNATHTRAELDPMPSEWQPGGKFKDVRTLDLESLADVIADYTRIAGPLYNKAANEAVAAVRAAYTPGGLDSDRATALTQKIMATLTKLEREWGIATEPLYDRATKIAVDSARDLTGLPVLSRWRQLSRGYGMRAMQFLTEPGGLLSDLRARVAVTINALSSERAVAKSPKDIDSTVPLAVAATAMQSVFSSEQHRVNNWSGRLVELANATLSSGMDEASTEIVGGAPVPTQWWCEWVSVGDERTCPTCDEQGSAGFRPLSSLSTTPGGDTECQARCRCVLVLWTRGEVASGGAVSLN